MCRPSRGVLLVIVFLATLATNARADDVADYLERLGLSKLLAIHLQEQLEAAKGEERNDLVMRLATIYSQLLEAASDQADRIDLEQRAQKLLATAPKESTDELRLALFRGSFRAAEKIAEDHRLRQSTPQQVDQAKETLTGLIPKLRDLRMHLRKQSDLAERRLIRASGAQMVTLVQEAKRYHRLLAQCKFLNAWALYYQSWLHQRSENARIAEVLFADLLEAESSRPQPEDISVDLRSNEAIARSILGMALCKSLTASSITAIRWVQLLEHEQTFGELRTQAPVWKITVHLEHDEFRAARSILENVQADEQVPLTWIRLAAVYALEAKSQNAEAGKLAQWAVAQLAARGELQQVSDLAQRYGADALGSSGFAMRYVRGVGHYQRARDLHGSQRPTVEMRLVELYERAAVELEAALSEPDAFRYTQAAAGCRWLIAWCSYFQSRFLDARSEFEEVIDELPAEDAPEALWMAIICLDNIVKASNSPSLAAELSSLISRFLAQYPSSPRAPRLIVKRAAASKSTSLKVIEELLSVPANSEAYEDARKQAALALYKLFRDSSGTQRSTYGKEYLVVAAPLLNDAPDMDAASNEQYISRCRRILEVALSEEVAQLLVATKAFDALDRLEFDLLPYQDEIDYRRVQESLLNNNTFAAARVARELWQRNQGSIWSRGAQRTVFNSVRQQLKNNTNVPEALGLIVKCGQRILTEFEAQPDSIKRSSVLAYHIAVADALMQQFKEYAIQQSAHDALILYEKVLSVRPRDAHVLRAVAELSEKSGNNQRALTCWRALVAGSDQSTESWYEAKYHLILVLAEMDLQRARAVMHQLKLLNPDYGPEPWRALLAALDKRINSLEGRLQ